MQHNNVGSGVYNLKKKKDNILIKKDGLWCITKEDKYEKMADKEV